MHLSFKLFHNFSPFVALDSGPVPIGTRTLYLVDHRSRF
jgi:hypothetical protein